MEALAGGNSEEAYQSFSFPCKWPGCSKLSWRREKCLLTSMKFDMVLDIIITKMNLYCDLKWSEDILSLGSGQKTHGPCSRFHPREVGRTKPIEELAGEKKLFYKSYSFHKRVTQVSLIHEHIPTLLHVISCYSCPLLTRLHPQCPFSSSSCLRALTCAVFSV